MARRLAISKHLARILLDCRQWVTLRPLLLRIATTSASGKDRGQLLHLCLHRWLKKRQRRMYAARTRRTMSTRYVYESLSPIMVRHVSHCNVCEGAPCSFHTHYPLLTHLHPLRSVLCPDCLRTAAKLPGLALLHLYSILSRLAIYMLRPCSFAIRHLSRQSPKNSTLTA